MNQETFENEKIIKTIDSAYPGLGNFLRTFPKQTPCVQEAFLEAWSQLVNLLDNEKYGIVGIRVRPKSIRVVSAKAKIFSEVDNFLDKADKFLLH